MLSILATRGIDLPDEVRARITGCPDLDQIETWLCQAVTATTVKELFD